MGNAWSLRRIRGRFDCHVIQLSPKSVHPGSDPLAQRTPDTTSPLCLKCGNIKKSGKRSCCARGGAWFKNCGDAGNAEFEHTWIEGIQACKSRLGSDCVLRCVVVMRCARSLCFSYTNSDRLITVTAKAKTVVGASTSGEPLTTTTTISRTVTTASTSAGTLA